MSNNQAAARRHAQGVCIITLLPVFRQLKKRIAIGFAYTEKPTIVYLETATIKITESTKDDLVIEIEPP
jgi:hypothetical protein